MATWHQIKAGNHIPRAHMTEWTVFCNPPNRCAASMLFVTEQEARQYMKNRSKYRPNDAPYDTLVPPVWVGVADRAIQAEANNCLDASDLDELIHEMHELDDSNFYNAGEYQDSSEHASAVNNGGLADQIAYLAACFADRKQLVDAIINCNPACERFFQ